MTPGYYVIREAKGSPARKRTTLILESRVFTLPIQAHRWSEWIKKEHPKDDVYVIQIHAEEKQ